MTFQSYNRPFRFLVIAVSGIAFFLGVELGSFNLVLYTVSRDFGLETSLMGFLVTAQYFTITVSPLILGFVSDKIGKKKTLLIFMPVFTLGCFIAAASGTLEISPFHLVESSVWFFIIGVFIIGIGYSACESVGGSALSDTFPGKEGRYINIMQGAFSLGAVASPLFFRWLMDNFNLTWHWVFLIPGCGFILLYPILLLSACRSQDLVNPGVERTKSPSSIFKSSFFPVLLFCMMAYVALESGISYFIDSLLITEFENSSLSAWTISGFWFSMALSRFFFATTKIKPHAITLLGFTVAAVLLMLLFTFRIQWVFFYSILCLGFAIGPIWPTLMGIGMSAFPKQSGAVGGILYSGGGVGGIIMPLAFGAMAEYAGFYSGFLLMAFIAVLGSLAINKYF